MRPADDLLPRSAAEHCETLDQMVIAIEVKATASPTANDARHMAWLRDRLGSRFAAGIVLHLGEYCLSYGDRLFSLPVSALWSHAQRRADGPLVTVPLGSCRSGVVRLRT